MRLVWAVLPLAALGIVGISESYAEEEISVLVFGGELLNFGQLDELGSMVFNIHMQSDGSLIAELPYSVWHLADFECKPVSPLVLIDGAEARFVEYFEKNKRIITINVEDGSKEILLLSSGPAAPHTTYLMYGKFCFLKEQGVFLSPKKQLDLGFMFHDVQCKDSLVKVFKIRNQYVCVKHSSMIQLLLRGWASTNSFEITDGFFEHKIENGKITSIKADLTRCGFIDLRIQPEDDGSIAITIPKKIFDLQPTDRMDLGFMVLVDGKQVDYKETEDVTQRTFIIDFEKDSKTIEIAKICLI